MAARKRIGLSENTRERIKTSMLLNRLTDHILGKVELTATQVRGIEILLKKTLPDLASLQIDANVTTNSHEEALDKLEHGTSTEDRITH